MRPAYARLVLPVLALGPVGSLTDISVFVVDRNFPAHAGLAVYAYIAR
jgi:hypothetical protein